jgi:hypothetical protein
MGSETIDFNADDTTPTNTGHAIVAISIAAFGELSDFKRRVDKLVREIRRSKRMPGVERVWLPGEQSRAKLEERTRLGIPIPDALRASLDKLAADLKIKALSSGRPQSNPRRRSCCLPALIALAERSAGPGGQHVTSPVRIGWNAVGERRRCRSKTMLRRPALVFPAQNLPGCCTRPR